MFIDLRERERERERDIDVRNTIGCFLYTLQPGIETAT